MPRVPEYLSPTAMTLWKKNPQEYFIRYLCATKAPKIPQTPAMAVGSAFDAFVKSYLHERLCPLATPEDKTRFELTNLFDSQVEEHNRQITYEYGSHLFDMYKQSGALSDLMLELSKAIDTPKFELDLRGVIRGPDTGGVTRHLHGVTLLGKPDVRFINSAGGHVILDWKVNGFLSKSPVSPAPGYVMCRDHDAGVWVRRGCHKDCFITPLQGMMVNSRRLEDVNVDWATQLCTYGWLMGEEVGREMIVAVDQFCGNKDSLRIASHRTTVGAEFQHMILNSYLDLWNIIHDPAGVYFFRELSREQSVVKQESLEKQVEMMASLPDGSEADWIAKMARS